MTPPGRAIVSSQPYKTFTKRNIHARCQIMPLTHCKQSVHTTGFVFLLVARLHTSCSVRLLCCLLCLVLYLLSCGVGPRYGLEVPGIEMRWGPDFPHSCRPALGPTLRPVKGAHDLFLGSKAAGS